jgi:hypothetical protein
MNGDDQQVNEIDVISRALHFSEFASFYKTKWEPRKFSMDWKINPSCPMFAMQLFDKNKRPYILLQHLPDNLDDAFLVAHEMMHVINYFDKQYIEFKPMPFASNYKENEIKEMAAMLGSMLDDPLIDKILQDEKYGFNPASFYANVLIPDKNRSLDSYGDPPYEWHVFKKALTYSQFALQCDSISDVNVLDEWNKLKARYKVRRPKVTKIGEELYSMSTETEYDSIEKQQRLFGKIFNKYRINGVKLGDILNTN